MDLFVHCSYVPNILTIPTHCWTTWNLRLRLWNSESYLNVLMWEVVIIPRMSWTLLLTTFHRNLWAFSLQIRKFGFEKPCRIWIVSGYISCAHFCFYYIWRGHINWFQFSMFLAFNNFLLLSHSILYLIWTSFLSYSEAFQLTSSFVVLCRGGHNPSYVYRLITEYYSPEDYVLQWYNNDAMFLPYTFQIRVSSFLSDLGLKCSSDFKASW